MRIILLTLVLAAFLAGCGSIDNTPTPAPLVDLKPQVNIHELWLVNTGKGTGEFYLKLLPTVADGRVFTASANGYVTASKESSGGEIWRTDTGISVSAGPSVAGDLVIVAGTDGDVIALEQSTGKIVWHQNAENEILAAPVINSNKVIVKTIEGKVYSFDLKTGKKLWTYHHGAPSLVLRGSSEPRIGNGEVYVGFDDGKLAAISLSKGNLLWERTIAAPRGSSAIEQMVDIDADPLLTNDALYVATYQGNIVRIGLPSGQLLWRHKISSYTGINYDSSRLYITDADSNIWAFDRDSGAVVWKTDKLLHRNITAPVVMGDAIVVGDGEGYLHWISRDDGHLLARTYVDKSGIIAPPTVVGNKLFVTTKAGNLAAYQA